MSIIMSMRKCKSSRARRSSWKTTPTREWCSLARTPTHRMEADLVPSALVSEEQMLWMLWQESPGSWNVQRLVEYRRRFTNGQTHVRCSVWSGFLGCWLSGACQCRLKHRKLTVLYTCACDTECCRLSIFSCAGKMFQAKFSSVFLFFFFFFGGGGDRFACLLLWRWSAWNWRAPCQAGRLPRTLSWRWPASWRWRAALEPL